jgi:hypothetical protein
MFLYANGDSFVEGCELGDFLLPDYPGARNFNSPNDPEVRQWFNNIHVMETAAWSTRKDLLPKIQCEEKQRNFVAKLAGHLNVDFLNSALGGSGIDRIARTTIADLIELKKTKIDIIAVIGTAEPIRLELPCADSALPPWRMFHPGNPITVSPFSEVTNYYYMNVSNYHRIMFLLKNVVLIQDFCRANEIKLIWVSGNSVILDDYPVEEQYANEKDICQLLDYTKFRPPVSMKDIARDINYNTVLPGYHFSEVVHEETARQLAELI